MPKVNFYLLKQSGVEALQLFACKLAEQLSRQGQRVYLHAANADEAQALDQLLWSFAPESFVPHARCEDPAAATAQVLIGTGGAPAHCNCLLNLTDAEAPAHAGLTAVAEFVQNNEAAKAQSRARWNSYKQQGWELQHHTL